MPFFTVTTLSLETSTFQAEPRAAALNDSSSGRSTSESAATPGMAKAISTTASFGLLGIMNESISCRWPLVSDYQIAAHQLLSVWTSRMAMVQVRQDIRWLFFAVCKSRQAVCEKSSIRVRQG